MSDWNIEECDIQTLCYLSQCGLNLENADFRFLMGKIYPYILSIVSCVENYHEYLDVYAISEVKSFVEKEMTSSHDISPVIDLLFSSLDYQKMNSDIYELYDDISSYVLGVYFDGYNNAEVRRRCEEIIKCMEDKINSVDNEKVRNRLYTMFFLTLGKFHMHDWNELPTRYSYRDKMFLNKVWSKYGWYHFKNLIYIIDQLHIKELLPQVLIPLNISLGKLKANLLYCEKQVQETETIINKIITKAFLDFNDEIKSDNDLTRAFEEFLQLLVEFNMEEAAVILDEFRIH